MMSVAFGMLGLAALRFDWLRMNAVSVILDIPTRSLSGAFSYSVPPELRERVTIGCGVLVEFGHRPAIGWVVGEAPADPEIELKPVTELLTGSRFDRTAVELSTWMARRYCAPLSDALRVWLPGGTTPRLQRRHAFGADAESGEWYVREPTVTSVEERWVEADPASGHTPPTNATVQRAILDALSGGPVSVAELKSQLGSIDGSLRTLAEKGAVTITERRRYRSDQGKARAAIRHETLSQGQSAALQAIESAAPGGVVLLEGVTGSGKTEVYMRAIERVVERGSSAIVLVPEISLTPQTVGRFRSRFGTSVAVLHSRLGGGERLDEWDRIASGEARVVVGARSALFAPARELGLIVIDEEHSTSYKQGQAPRYDARDVAVELARLRGCPVVMGSATPSLERIVAAAEGRITSVPMPERVGGGALPPVAVVDMGAEFASGNRSMFSGALTTALTHNAEAGRRSILLLNRRGFASFLLCRECGHVPMCDSCSTSLTYHEGQTGHLACHHCGARRHVPATCPECDSPYLRQFGAGTQRVEHELAEMLPGVPIVRMDADTTTGKGGHERILASFEAQPGAVLVGTQMVAKGLDYPDVTLVGVLNADTTLHLPDFRSAERTFQMLAQVAGRAGRSDVGGEVVIQTYWPSHPAIVAAARHDPGLFYPQERAERTQLGYPPFGRLANIVVSGPSEREVADAAARLAKAVGSFALADMTVLGPSPAPLAKVKRAYRWHVLLKAPDNGDVSSVVTAALDQVGRVSGVSMAPDVDPQDLL